MSASVSMDETVAALQARLEKSEKAREKMKQVLVQLRDDGKKTAGLLELLEKTQADLASSKQQLQQERDSHASTRDQLQKQADQLKQQLDRANSRAKAAATVKGLSSAAAAHAVPVSMASSLEAANKQLKQEQADRRKLQEQIAQLTAKLHQAGQQNSLRPEEPGVDMLRERVGQLERDLQQASTAGNAAAAALECEREQRKMAAATASKELALLRKQLKEVKESSAAGGNGVASKQATELAHSKAELAHAQQELERHRAEASHSRQEAEAARQQAQQLRSSLHEVQLTLTAQQERADAAQQEANGLQQRLRKLQAQYRQLQADNAQLQAQLQGGAPAAAAAGVAASTVVAATSSDGADHVSPQLQVLQQQMSSMQHLMADLVSVMDQEQRSKSLAVQLLQGSFSGPYGLRQPAPQQSDIHAADPLARVRSLLHNLMLPQPIPQSNGSQAPLAQQHSPFNAVQGVALDLEGSQGSGLGPMPASRDTWRSAAAAAGLVPGPSGRDTGVGLQRMSIAGHRRHPEPHEHTPDHSNLSASTSESDHGMQPVIGFTQQPLMSGSHLRTAQPGAPFVGNATVQELWPPALPPDTSLQCRASYNNVQAAAANVRHAQGHLLSAGHMQPDSLQHLDSSKGSGSGPAGTFNQVPSSSPSPSPHPDSSPDTFNRLVSAAAAAAALAARTEPQGIFSASQAPDHAFAGTARPITAFPGGIAKAASEHSAPELEAPIAKRQRLMQGAAPVLLPVATAEAAPSSAAQKTGRKGRPPKPRSGEELLEPVLTWSEKPLTRGSSAKAAATAVKRAAKGIATALRSGACSPAALVAAFETAVLKCVSPTLQPVAPKHGGSPCGSVTGQKPAAAGDISDTPVGMLLGGVGWGGWCLPCAWSSGTVMLLAQAAAGAEQELQALTAAAASKAAGSSAAEATGVQPVSILSSLYPRLVSQVLPHGASEHMQAAPALELTERCALVAAFMEIAHTAGDKQVARGLLDDLLTAHASYTTRRLHVLLPLLYAAVSVWPQALLMHAAVPAAATDPQPGQHWDPLGACLCAQITQVCLQAAQPVSGSRTEAEHQLLQQVARDLLQLLASLPQSPAHGTLMDTPQGAEQVWLPVLGLCLSAAHRCLSGTGQQGKGTDAIRHKETDLAAVLTQVQHVLLAAGLHLPFPALLDKVLLVLLVWQPQLSPESRVQAMSMAAAVCQGQLQRTKHVLSAPLPQMDAVRCMDICSTLAGVLKAYLDANSPEDGSARQGQPLSGSERCPPDEYVLHSVVVLTCCMGTLMLPPDKGVDADGQQQDQDSEALLRARLAPLLQMLKQWARASPASMGDLPDVVRQLLSEFVGIGCS